MKLKKEFITHETNGEYIMVSAGNTKFNGLVRSNRTAGFIIDCLKSETSESEIIEKMLKKYDAPKKIISADVRKVIYTLCEIGAIDA